MLIEAYPESMGIPIILDSEKYYGGENASGGKGDTPFIMAVRTFKGGNEEEEDGEDFNLDLMNLENGPMAMQPPVQQPVVQPQAQQHGMPQPVAQQPVMENENDGVEGVNPNEVENVPEAAEAVVNEQVAEIGEEEADYEADLSSEGDNSKPKVDAGEDAASAIAVEENGVPAPEVDGNDQALEEPNNNNNNNEEEPNLDLEVVRIMIETATRTNKLSALQRSNDDGDTPLHMGKCISPLTTYYSNLSLFLLSLFLQHTHIATRIGAHSRLITMLLNARPSVATIQGNDGDTPLHLMLRRCSHLSPEGVGGMAVYDEEMVQLMLNAAGNKCMSILNDDGRSPIHEAAYYGASPEVLEVLCNFEGGRDALLLRDEEGHTPLGAYCRHAADYYSMRVLVNHCPEAAAAMADGKRLALHRVLASFNLSVNVDVLRLLGEAYPPAVNLKDAHRMTPLALLCESYKGPMGVDLPKLLANRTTLARW